MTEIREQGKNKQRPGSARAGGKGRRKRLPSYLKKPLGRPAELHALKKTLRDRGLNTVCESARCPNIYDPRRRLYEALRLLCRYQR